MLQHFAQYGNPCMRSESFFQPYALPRKELVCRVKLGQSGRKISLSIETHLKNHSFFLFLQNIFFGCIDI